MRVSLVAADAVRAQAMNARKSLKKAGTFLHELNDAEDWRIALGAIEEVYEDARDLRNDMLKQAMAWNRKGTT